MRVRSSGRRDWVQAAEASNGDLELERRGEHTYKAPRTRQAGHSIGYVLWTGGLLDRWRRIGGSKTREWFLWSALLGWLPEYQKFSTYARGGRKGIA